MSAFETLTSRIFPWQRGSGAPTMTESSPAMRPWNTRTKLSVYSPAYVPPGEQPAENAEKAGFTWSVDAPEFVPAVQRSAEDAEQSEVTGLESKIATDSFSATATPTSCSLAGSTSDSHTDSSSSPSEPEDEADEKLHENAPKDSAPLKASTNSWSAAIQARRKKVEQGSESLSDEEIVRKMKSILNKLTIEKFGPLSRQLTSCGIQNISHLEALIHEICAKATTQHHFVNMYADLCVVLQAHFASLNTSMNFKQILLRACQASFEKHLTPPASLKNLEGEELVAAERLYKVQMIGNIRFVGALVVRKMLAVKVMLAIIEELLSVPTPEALESLAAFLTVVGPTFDQPEFQHHVLLSAIFSRVVDQSNDSRVKPRVRCLLKDVVELRASGWQDCKPKKLEGPSTLEEVAQKFHTEVEVKHLSHVSSMNHACHAVLGTDHQANKWMELRQGLPQSSFGKPANMTEDRLMKQHQGLTQSYVAKPECKATELSLSPDGHFEGEKCSPSHYGSQTESQQLANSDFCVKNTSSKTNVTNELKSRLAQFLKDNIVDDEAAEDLKACPTEIQEMVLAKGDVTSARNPSAMLRVRINQAGRELKKISKDADLACPAKPSLDKRTASTQESNTVKSKKQPKKKK